MIVQIYEIQTSREAERCIQLGVDHLGSVLLSEEAWQVPELRETMRLSDGTQVKNSLIPLFRDRVSVYRSLEYYRPDYVHFCDNVSEQAADGQDFHRLIEFQGEIKERFPEIGVIRSIPVPRVGLAPAFSPLDIAQAFESASDLFLLDTWQANAPVEGYIGITGQPLDWDKARELVARANIPVLLAGGLSPENVFEALLKVLPAGADSCTRTNKVDQYGKPIRFKKDFHKVKRFAEEVRRAEKAISTTAGKAGLSDSQFVTP